MAANPTNAVATLYAVQYDGTNSGDIAALDAFDFNNATESGGTWTFQSPPDSTTYTFHTGDWVLYAQNQVMQSRTNIDFLREYSCNALCADVEALEALAVTPKVQSMGVAPVPSLILNASTTVTVTLHPAMPDDTYTAYASKFAGISITDLVINSVTVVDEDTVQVAVQNTGLVTLAGANILVHAVA